jgi:hypothetical protein
MLFPSRFRFRLVILMRNLFAENVVVKDVTEVSELMSW